MQTPLPPDLQQLLGAANYIKPVTMDGTPTVAAQVMQTADQKRAAEMGGIANGLDQQKQQQMQEVMRRFAEAQQANQPVGMGGPPMLAQGIGSGAPNPSFADGGIVGYAAGGGAQDPYEELKKRVAAMDRGAAAYEAATAEPTPEAILARARQNREANRAWAVETGNNPDYLQAQIKENQDLAAKRQALLDRQMEQSQQADAPYRRLLNAMMGARGRSSGDIVGSANSAMEQQMAQQNSAQFRLQNESLRIQELTMTANRALAEAKYKNDMGDYSGAQEALAKAAAAKQAVAKMQIDANKDAGQLAERMGTGILNSRTELEKARIMAAARTQGGSDERLKYLNEEAKRLRPLVEKSFGQSKKDYAQQLQMVENEMRGLMGIDPKGPAAASAAGTNPYGKAPPGAVQLVGPK